MPNITAGTVASVYCPLAGTITITPGTSGRVSFQSRSISGGQSAAPQDIYSETTVNVSAGDTVSLEAINVDATYTTPAGADTALSALVLGAVFSAVTYDAQGRVVGYSLNGAAHTIEYPNSVTVVLSNDSGSRTVGLDASGRVASIT